MIYLRLRDTKLDLLFEIARLTNFGDIPAMLAYETKYCPKKAVEY